MNALAQYLKSHGVSTVEFARLVGAHRTQIWRAKAGRRGVGLDLAARIEAVTGGEVPSSTWLRSPMPAACSQVAPARKTGKRVPHVRAAAKSGANSRAIGTR